MRALFPILLNDKKALNLHTMKRYAIVKPDRQTNYVGESALEEAKKRGWQVMGEVEDGEKVIPVKKPKPVREKIDSRKFGDSETFGTVPSAENQAEAETIETSEVTNEPDFLELGAMNATNAKVYIDANPDRLNDFLQEEMEGKNRKGLINYINEKLG